MRKRVGTDVVIPCKATSAAAADLVLEELRRAAQGPKLETVADVADYLHKAANRCRAIGELKKSVRIARDALRKIATRGSQ